LFRNLLKKNKISSLKMVEESTLCIEVLHSNEYSNMTLLMMFYFSESDHSLDGILEDGCTTITEPLPLNKEVAGSETSDSREVLTSATVESNKVQPALLDNVVTNAVQRLVDRDMRMHRSKWLEFSREIAEVGTDIEHVLFKVMIDELIEDLYPGASKNWNIPLN
jgi:hypothetical protein